VCNVCLFVCLFIDNNRPTHFIVAYGTEAKSIQVLAMQKNTYKIKITDFELKTADIILTLRSYIGLNDLQDLNVSK